MLSSSRVLNIRIYEQNSVCDIWEPGATPLADRVYGTWIENATWYCFPANKLKCKTILFYKYDTLHVL